MIYHKDSTDIRTVGSGYVDGSAANAALRRLATADQSTLNFCLAWG